ncbi:MAG: UDP-N-acetylmuramoyl-L-alanine--D-glutamate ligase [Lentisphaerae bacterium]|nr:MAG: UDP-N-acetylmuramoyl-L-alanine--D-glutamate ligase [Lentisphaerota bacterium]
MQEKCNISGVLPEAVELDRVVAELRSGGVLFVFGLGESGLEAALLARKMGACVLVYDESGGESVKKRASTLQELGIGVFLNSVPDGACLPDLVVLSPGIPPASRLYRRAFELDCPVVSELQFAREFLSDIPMVGITGTNGKTTTTELVAHLLTKMGYHVGVGGNIGTPLSRLARERKNWDFLIVECSSFQLMNSPAMKWACGVFLNFGSDHLDWHASEAEYFMSKCRIWNTTGGERRGALANDSLFAEAERLGIDLAEAGLVTFSLDNRHADYFWDDVQNAVICRENHRILLTATDLPITLRLRHNRENILAALAVIDRLGLADGLDKAFLSDFVVAPHRFEICDGVAKGVTVINDSKATNPAAVESAIKALAAGFGSSSKARIFLIAGGRDKKMDFGKLNPLLKEHVQEALLFGENRYRLAECWADATLCNMCETLEHAVDLAFSKARPGDTILFSPGCASFDMFQSYIDRGNQFKQALKRRQSNANPERQLASRSAV